VLLYHTDYEKLVENKVVVTAKDMDINLIHIDDLIEMKHFSGRLQDKSDIKILKKVKKLQQGED